MAKTVVQQVAPVRYYIREHVQAFIHDWKQPIHFDWRATLVILIGAILLYPLTVQLPMLGYDWYFFDRQVITNYPPWVNIVLRPLTIWDWRDGLALLNGILLGSLAVGTAREAWQQSRVSRFIAIGMSILAAPTLMLMWQANPTPLVLFGYLALPYGLIYAGLQPHLIFFAILSRRAWIYWALGFVILSVLLFGFWMPALFQDAVTERIGHPIAMGVAELGIPILLIGIAMLPFTRADPLQMMALGCFFVPYLMSVHFILLLPALGRVRGYRRWLLWFSAWLAFLPAMFMNLESKYAAMIFPLMVWWFLRPTSHNQSSQESASL